MVFTIVSMGFRTSEECMWVVEGRRHICISYYYNSKSGELYYAATIFKAHDLNYKMTQEEIEEKLNEFSDEDKNKISTMIFEKANENNLLNKINFNRALKSKGGSVGFLMDTSLNQPLKINKIDTIQPLRMMYQKGGQVNKSKILDLISKIDLKDLNLTDLKDLHYFHIQ